MNDQPTPYTPPRRRSHVTVVKGGPVASVTLSPLIKGMVTGTLGDIPLSSAVYAQLALQTQIDESIAWVRLVDGYEVLGLSNGHIVRAGTDNPVDGLPQLILTEGSQK